MSAWDKEIGKMPYYVCIDIGGTTIKYGLADKEGTFYDTALVPTEIGTKGVGHVIDTVTDIVKTYQTDTAITGVAISTAGIVDMHTGIIRYAAPHFPGYIGTDWPHIIHKECSLPCAVENDVNAAGLGEYWQGAGQGMDPLFCLTVGTGIGGCIMLDGKVVHGVSGSAGEIGYLPLASGKSLEELASVTALIQAVRAAKPHAVNVTGKDILAWAEQGDAAMQAALDDMIGHLAAGIAAVCYVIDPAMVIVGGGMMSREDYFRPRLTAALQQKLIPAMWNHTQLAFAQLGNHAGMAGALYHLLHRLPEHNKVHSL
jgi:predicted NBD/HSP70 family sugar kinase